MSNGGRAGIATPEDSGRYAVKRRSRVAKRACVIGDAVHGLYILRCVRWWPRHMTYRPESSARLSFRIRPTGGPGPRGLPVLMARPLGVPPLRQVNGSGPPCTAGLRRGAELQTGGWQLGLVEPNVAIEAGDPAALPQVPHAELGQLCHVVLRDLRSHSVELFRESRHRLCMSHRFGPVS